MFYTVLSVTEMQSILEMARAQLGQKKYERHYDYCIDFVEEFLNELLSNSDSPAVVSKYLSLGGFVKVSQELRTAMAGRIEEILLQKYNGYKGYYDKFNLGNVTVSSLGVVGLSVVDQLDMNHEDIMSQLIGKPLMRVDHKFLTDARAVAQEHDKYKHDVSGNVQAVLTDVVRYNYDYGHPYTVEGRGPAVRLVNKLRPALEPIIHKVVETNGVDSAYMPFFDRGVFFMVQGQQPEGFGKGAEKAEAEVA